MPNNKILDTNALYAVKDYVDGLIGDLPIPTAKYQHNVYIDRLSSDKTVIYFSFITSSATAYNNNTLCNALYDAGFTGNTKACPASGYIITGTSVVGIMAVYGNNVRTAGLSQQQLNFRTMTLGTFTSSTSTFTISSSASGNIGYSNAFLVSSSNVVDTVVAV